MKVMPGKMGRVGIYPIFIITNTMQTIGVDKITLFKTNLKQRVISYMFRSSLDHHQGGLSLIREAT